MSKLLKNKLSRRIVLLAAVLIVLFGFTVYKDQKTLVESGAGTALNPVQSVLYTVNKRMESFIDFFLRYEEVKEENESLLLENIELNFPMIGKKNLFAFRLLEGGALSPPGRKRRR